MKYSLEKPQTQLPDWKFIDPLLFFVKTSDPIAAHREDIQKRIFFNERENNLHPSFIVEQDIVERDYASKERTFTKPFTLAPAMLPEPKFKQRMLKTIKEDKVLSDSDDSKEEDEVEDSDEYDSSSESSYSGTGSESGSESSGIKEYNDPVEQMREDMDEDDLVGNRALVTKKEMMIASKANEVRRTSQQKTPMSDAMQKIHQKAAEITRNRQRWEELKKQRERQKLEIKRRLLMRKQMLYGLTPDEVALLLPVPSALSMTSTQGKPLQSICSMDDTATIETRDSFTVDSRDCRTVDTRDSMSVGTKDTFGWFDKGVERVLMDDVSDCHSVCSQDSYSSDESQITVEADEVKRLKKVLPKGRRAHRKVGDIPGVCCGVVDNERTDEMFDDVAEAFEETRMSCAAGEDLDWLISPSDVRDGFEESGKMLRTWLPAQ